ncbi:MAG: hypothetical protein ACTSWW_05320 [Promethearchaeota archaeon]
MVFNSLKAQDSIGLGVILDTVAILLLWFWFDTVVFLISVGYLAVLGFRVSPA